MENHYNCIYMYINKINGKRYIGQAKNFKSRHNGHLKGRKQLIDKAINEFGIENFEIKILKENLTPDEMDKYECKYISDYKTTDFDCNVFNVGGYNVALGGKNGGCYLRIDEELDELIRRIENGEEIEQIYVYDEILAIENIGKKFLSDDNVIVEINKYKYGTYAKIIGKLNDDITKYNEMRIIDYINDGWLEYQGYTEFIDDGKQIYTNAFEIQKPYK